MRGDEHAALPRDGLDGAAHLAIEPVELVPVGGRVALVGRAIAGVDVDQSVARRVDGVLPEVHVEPHVRVEAPGEARLSEQALARHLAGHRDGGPLLRQPREDVLHLAFELEAAVEDQVRFDELADVAGGGLVEMRVDARPHQAGDVDTVSADLARQVGDQVGGGDHPDLALGHVGGGRRRPTRGAARRSQQEREPDHGGEQPAHHESSTRIACANSPPKAWTSAPKDTNSGPPNGCLSTTSNGSPGRIPRSDR